MSTGPPAEDQYNFVQTSKFFSFYLDIQSNMSYVTFQGNSEIWSHKTGGRLIEVVTKPGLTVYIK
jgi:hypothetical protein